MQRLNENSEIHYVLNGAVKEKIAFYSTKAKGVIARAMGLAPLYFPLIEAELRKNNLPTDLKYITIRESGLNPSAGSEKGPRGLWQFMPGTAQVLGMKVNAHVDERKDPLISTKAACTYFTKLYKIYGDWMMVMAAYGSGSGTVDKAIKASGGKKTYWEILPFLPAVSKDHIPAFIAIAFVYNNSSLYNITPTAAKFSAFSLDSVMISKSLSFEQISKVLNIPKNDLVLLNPIYNKHRIHVDEGKTMLLVLPLGEAVNFRRDEKDIYKYKEAAH
ncbi:MAG: lytic transglycosylase domain-containing protein [Bacteroidetes bacterium]|nr:lytic transglycosylase domain-containing protein [Bacteroidota bacterium]